MLLSIIFLPAFVFHGVGCCDASFIILPAIRPHPSYPFSRHCDCEYDEAGSRKQEEGRYCIANPNFITAASALSDYSTLLKTLIDFKDFEKRGLCLDGPA